MFSWFKSQETLDKEEIDKFMKEIKEETNVEIKHIMLLLLTSFKKKLALPPNELEPFKTFKSKYYGAYLFFQRYYFDRVNNTENLGKKLDIIREFVKDYVEAPKIEAVK
ncbi:hypothetical protein ABK040_000326 [Willaertia magna]